MWGHASPLRARPGLSTRLPMWWRGMAGGGRVPIFALGTNEKRRAILNVCADTLTTPNVERPFKVPSQAQSVDHATLALRARRARGSDASAPASPRGTHAGHRAALRSVSALPRGGGRPDRFRPQNGQLVCVAHGHGIEAGQGAGKRARVCLPSGARNLRPFCLACGRPCLRGATPRLTIVCPGRARDPMPPFDDVAACPARPVVYGRWSPRARSPRTPIYEYAFWRPARRT